MNKIRRIASLMVLIAFICNTFLFDTGFAQELKFINNASTLATAMKTDDILGSESRNVRIVGMWFLGCVDRIRNGGYTVNIDNLKNTNILPAEYRNNLKDFQIFWNEASSDGVVINLNVRKAGGNDYLIKYYIGSRNVKVFPKNQALISETAAAGVTAQDLKIMTRVLERDVINMIYKAGSGHPGGSLSMLKMITALYFGEDSNGQQIMRYDPKDPNGANRDRLVLSKGHAAPGLYAALGRAGFFPAQEFDKLRKLGSILQGHTDMTKTPGVDMSAGSLGVGISAAVGMALAAKMDGRTYTTYFMLGDGETQEGQVDEAARSAAAMKLNNIVAFLDWNGMQIDGKVTETDVDYDGQVALWEARGWEVIKVNKDDVEDILKAIRRAKRATDRPTIIIVKTIKGAGLPGMDKHGAAPKETDVKAALEIINADMTRLGGEGFNADTFIKNIGEKAGVTSAEKRLIDDVNAFEMNEQEKRRQEYITSLGQKSLDAIAAARNPYFSDKKVSTRTANGHELVLLGNDDPRVVAISADLKGSVMFVDFENAFGPYSAGNTLGRYIPAGIREAHMVSMAAGLAACGKIPVIGTFSIFTTRMVDQLNAILNTKLPIIIVGTHGGLATGPDGRTHQDAHSLAVLGALPGLEVYEGADAQEERVLLRHIYGTAKEKGGIHYIRPARLDTPILEKPAGWEEGARRGFYELYDSEFGKPKTDKKYDITIISTGVTAVDAVEAAKELAKQGKRVKVVNVTRPKSITADENISAFAGMIGDSSHIVSVIDALPEILGDKINHVLVKEKIYPVTVKALGINKYGESGTPAELYKLHGFDKEGIVKAALESFGPQITGQSPLLKFKEIGQQIWLDGLTWEMIKTGKFEDLARNHNITGVTTNPSLIKAYLNDEEVLAGIAKLAAQGKTRDEIYFEVIKELAQAVIYVFNKCGVDGKFSVELSPDKANDVAASVAEAKMWAGIDREHMMIKVASTEEGYKIIEELTAAGINVNATLIFTEAQYRKVAHVYIRGLERAVNAGIDVSKVYSVASFFVSRWDVELAELPEYFQGKVANAVTIAAYNGSFIEIFNTPAFKALEDKGANIQDFLVASTGSKGADMVKKEVIPPEFQKHYPPLVYVESIEGANVVNTLPIGTIENMIQDGVKIDSTITKNYSSAVGVLNEAGKTVNLAEVGKKLFDAGMKSFLSDFATIMKTIDDTLAKTAAPVEITASASSENASITSIEKALSPQDDINMAVKLADQAGLQIPTNIDTRYNLLVAEQFFKNGELDAHKVKYADRFNVDSVSGKDFNQFVLNVLSKASGKESKTIVLVPDDLPEDYLDVMTEAGIRFIPTNVNELLKARSENDEYRAKFQLDTYVVMLLARAIDEKTDKNAPVYRLLSFYLKTHFIFSPGITVDDYIMAIAKNDIAKLVQGILSYRPAKEYDKPDYGKVAATLISA